MKQFFNSKEAARLAGITYRQLDHWSKSGIIEPEISKARGKGTRRLFSFRNLVQLKLIKKLNEAGESIYRLRGEAASLLTGEENIPGDPEEVFQDREYWIMTTDGITKIDFNEIMQELRSEVLSNKGEQLRLTGFGKLEASPAKGKQEKIVIKGVRTPVFKPGESEKRKQA